VERRAPHDALTIYLSRPNCTALQTSLQITRRPTRTHKEESQAVFWTTAFMHTRRAHIVFNPIVRIFERCLAACGSALIASHACMRCRGASKSCTLAICPVDLKNAALPDHSHSPLTLTSCNVPGSCSTWTVEEFYWQVGKLPWRFDTYPAAGQASEQGPGAIAPSAAERQRTSVARTPRVTCVRVLQVWCRRQRTRAISNLIIYLAVQTAACFAATGRRLHCVPRRGLGKWLGA
jgi:hypothetical protein